MHKDSCGIRPDQETKGHSTISFNVDTGEIVPFPRCSRDASLFLRAGGARGFSADRLQIRVNQVISYAVPPVTVVHAYRYELVLPFPAIVLNQRPACYRSTRYVATRQLRSSVLTARANQLHRMPLVCAVAADQHVLNMAK